MTKNNASGNRTANYSFPIKRLAVWTFFWVLSQAVAVFGAKWVWEGNKILSALFIGLTLLLGMVMIYANRNVLEQQDELQKKIQLEAMGLTLGLTLVLGLCYSLLDATNVISGDAEIGVLVMFMGICYLTLVLINNRRYQ